MLFRSLSTTRQPYDDVQNPTQLAEHISPSKLSATYRLSSLPDPTPKSTSSGSLATQQIMAKKRQISVERKQPNSHNAQGNHLPQLPTLRDKFNNLDFRSGNQFGRPTTGAPLLQHCKRVAAIGSHLETNKTPSNRLSNSHNHPPTSTATWFVQILSHTTTKLRLYKIPLFRTSSNRQTSST